MAEPATHLSGQSSTSSWSVSVQTKAGVQSVGRTVIFGLCNYCCRLARLRPGESLSCWSSAVCVCEFVLGVQCAVAVTQRLTLRRQCATIGFATWLNVSGFFANTVKKKRQMGRENFSLMQRRPPILRCWLTCCQHRKCKTNPPTRPPTTLLIMSLRLLAVQARKSDERKIRATFSNKNQDRQLFVSSTAALKSL